MARGDRIARWASVPAPVGGWDTLSPLTAMHPLRAVALDNFTPQPGYVEFRRGYRVHAAGMPAQPVQTLAQWSGGATNKLFAFCSGEIYDVSVAGSAGSALVSGLNTSRFDTINFSTVGGHFLICASGQDSILNYDGVSWNTTPAITGPTDPAALKFPCAHKGRLWFIERHTMDAWYLSAGAIGGAATKFPLGSLFRMGGYLSAIGTFTAGQGYGTDDFIAFLSSLGEVIVYQGTDPSSTSTWALIGVYRVGAPVGDRPLLKYGPELMVVGLDGILPLSKIIPLDRVDAAKVSISATIQPALTAATSSYGDNVGWEPCLYPKSNIALVNVPIAEAQTSYQYVVNTITGAWSRWKGIDAACWLLYGNDLYFGGMSGTVSQADYGAFDNSTPIVADLQCAFSDFRTPGMLKHFKMVQPVTIQDGTINPLVGVDVDYQASLFSLTPPYNPIAAARWDSAVFDASVWPDEITIYQPWTGSSSLGRAAAVKMRVSSQNTAAASAARWDAATFDVDVWPDEAQNPLNFRITAFNVLFEVGSGL